MGLPQVDGVGTATNGGTTASVIAAQGVGKVMRVTKGVVGVTVAATGGGGLVRLCNGTTTIAQWPGDALGGYPFDFGDAGIALTSNTALQVIVSGAATTQASATITAVALVA